MQDNNSVFQKIAEALLTEYSNVYYINAVTHEYHVYSTDRTRHVIHTGGGGKDFFKDVVVDAKKIIFEDDIHYFTERMSKDNLRLWAQKGIMESFKYRIMIDGVPVWHHLNLIRGVGEGDEYYVLGVTNIDEEYRNSLQNEETAKNAEIFNQIATSLATHYDMIYYVNTISGRYYRFTTNSRYENLDVEENGQEFFNALKTNVKIAVYSEDRDRVAAYFDKDYLFSSLEDRKKINIDYRLTNGGRISYVRASTMWASDRVHLIICVENRDEAVRREKDYLNALSIANEKARRDELTGTKNKTAYEETAEAIQSAVDEGKCEPFAVVVCDINNLKQVNDTQGHKAGDDYIRMASRMVCSIFVHSPVYRFGGDEFVVILSGSDYRNRVEHLARLRQRSANNLFSNNGPVLASGLATYDPSDDKTYDDVFKRADARMYEDKAYLREKKIRQDSYTRLDRSSGEIPEDRKNKLDKLFTALETVSDGAYVYLCDMKYDYSRWSQRAVEVYGLPSKYMYGAGDIWEEHIHPDERAAYHEGIKNILSGTSSEHDMQYRARRPDGVYETCTCKGIVLIDANGEPEYFSGTIKSHQIKTSNDTLTGLKNEYGFFEDLNTLIVDGASANISIIGISRFVEINEIYGYMFGNSVLQRFGRYLLDHVGGGGSVYRVDGTKFVVISRDYSAKEMGRRYADVRRHFRDGFNIEGKTIILDLNAANLTLDTFTVDVQTVYTCLNFAYDESKNKRQGDMVHFHEKLTDESRQRIEKFHVIRSSIIDDYTGFVMFYQPVVDARTERLTGAEALIRWQNAEYGMIMPDQFISLLEKDSLYPELGKWIIKKSITDAKPLLATNPDFVISVNLSYTQMERPDFTDIVLEILKEVDFPAQNLCLEVTERCRLLDLNLLKNVIIRLRSHGVKFALDDFGTGFSSVGLMKNLPFDTIKIDRSFVSRIEEDDTERLLIEHFINAASLFEAGVCVEGIETPGMRDILQSYKVKSFQGYYYSKPLAYEKFLEWKKERESKSNEQ